MAYPLRDTTLADCHQLFEDLAQENRLKIVELLLMVHEANVTDLQLRLKLDQALISHHLKVLCDGGLVKVRKEGKFSFYSIDRNKLLRIMTALHFLLRT
jgi:DNA-binding transcriptional ArsR family regulator